MTLSEQIMLMRNELDAADREIKALEGGRKAASSRARKSLQNIKQSSHQLRKSIVEHTKALPVKSRKSPEEQMPMEEIRQLQAEPEPVEEEPKAATKKATRKRVLKKKV